jgi:hypothetical protein
LKAIIVNFSIFCKITINEVTYDNKKRINKYE